MSRLRSLAVRILPPGIRRRLRSWRRRGSAPPVGRVRLGDLARTRPISSDWGFERGTPIDRYLIEKFLEQHANDIHGRVLEVAGDAYTRRFGHDVTEVEILAVSERERAATIVADLADAPQIPDGRFDCVIVTQTLQYIWDVREAVATLRRILAPGGVALVSLPSVIRYDDGSWPDLWRFTPASARRLFEDAFGTEHIEVEAPGNVLAAAAFLYGLAAEELDGSVLQADDPAVPVSILIRARKAE